ncbi:MAG: pentapeptide repeat-containing protein [Solirubrobacteraceae bacterium]
MRRAAHAPQRPDLPRELAAGEIGSLAHDVGLLELELTEAALPDQRARGVRLETARLVRVDPSGSHLDELSAADVEFAGCNLANLESRRADVRRATLSACRMTGIRVSEATLSDVTVRGGRVDLASFASSRLTRVTFEGCLLAQTDFLDARLDSVRFDDCDLRRADFRGARLQRCEFRRCELAELQGVENLRGAALEWPAIVELAGVWAAALGVEVLDPD